MKLLVVTPYFYPKIGGLENYAWHICKGLKNKYGWQIVAVTSNHMEKKYLVETIEGIKIYRLPFWFKLSNTPINFGWIFDLLRIIKHENPDVVNAHTPVPFIADLAAIASYLCKIPFVLTYQNDLVKNNYLDTIFKIYYKTLGYLTFNLSKKIIVSSQYYAEKSPYLQKFLPKVNVIAPGIYINTKHNNKKMNTNTLLFVGQLDKTHIHKGLNYLIKALVHIREYVADIKLIIVGKGDYTEEYKKIAEKNNVLGVIDFAGFVPDEILGNIYENCSVVILPSISDSEGFGMTLLEAGAYHKPVIGSNVGGIPSVIIDRHNGFLVEPKDSLSLANKAIELLTNKELANKFGENGYIEVVNKYQWHTQVEKSHSLLKSLL